MLYVVDENGNEVKLPAVLKDFRGDEEEVVSISRAPGGGSTGRVATKMGEYFPGVFGLTIVERQEKEES